MNQFLFENIIILQLHLILTWLEEPVTDLASLLNKTDLAVKQQSDPYKSYPPAPVTDVNNVLTPSAVQCKGSLQCYSKKKKTKKNKKKTVELE